MVFPPKPLTNWDTQKAVCQEIILYNIILKQAQKLYGVLPIREIKTGHSGNLVFEMKTENQPCILRATEADEMKLAHAAFEFAPVC